MRLHLVDHAGDGTNYCRLEGDTSEFSVGVDPITSLMMRSFTLLYNCLIWFIAVSSEWVELPKVTPYEQSMEKSVLNWSASLNKSTSMLKTTTEGTSEKSSSYTKLIEPITHLVENAIKTEAEKEGKLNKESSIKSEKDLNFHFDETLPDKLTSYLKDEESMFVEKTLKTVGNDLLNKPRSTVEEKLKYLDKIKDKLHFQIRRLSQGLWTKRQARGKKFLAFASMEGALMTIAFLTFAVFLIKVVHQFIQGLQQHELLMTVALPPTATATASAAGYRSLSRHKRDQANLAAAQLLQYMDDFRIKHKFHCDYQDAGKC